MLLSNSSRTKLHAEINSSRGVYSVIYGSLLAALDLCVVPYDVESCGYHLLGSIWSPTIGEQLVCTREVSSANTVAVMLGQSRRPCSHEHLSCLHAFFAKFGTLSMQVGACK